VRREDARLRLGPSRTAAARRRWRPERQRGSRRDLRRRTRQARRERRLPAAAAGVPGLAARSAMDGGSSREGRQRAAPGTPGVRSIRLTTLGVRASRRRPWMAAWRTHRRRRRCVGVYVLAGASSLFAFLLFMSRVSVARCSSDAFCPFRGAFRCFCAFDAGRSQ
jgi:hypothetical protein